MKLIVKNDNLIYLIIPINLINNNKDITINKIKNIFLNYNKKYNLLEPGFYEVRVYNPKIVGTILLIEKIDTFDFSEEVDLRVSIKDKIKVYLKLIDETDFPDYKNKIDVDAINYKEYLKLIEHSNIIIDAKKVPI